MFPEGRIFDFLIVGVVALIVVGPKDLPVLMRRVGHFVARMRAMAAEFRASFDEIARQSELDELRREVEAMRAGTVLRGAAGLGPESEKLFNDIHAELDRAAVPSGPEGEPAKPAQADTDQPDLPFGEPPAPQGEPVQTVQPVKAAS
jgi:sec-independent protein translocase protein TatB